MEIKYQFCKDYVEMRKCFDEKTERDQHPRIYSSKPGSHTKKEYDGYKTSLIWQGIYPEKYFKSHPYVVVWFERQLRKV